MGMSTDVIIGHFLKAEDDISTIVHSDRFVDTVVDAGDSYYFSNHGNTVFHWSYGEEYEKPIAINNAAIESALSEFKEEIKEITNLLDLLKINWEIIYGAKTWYN